MNNTCVTEPFYKDIVEPDPIASPALSPIMHAGKFKSLKSNDDRKNYELIHLVKQDPHVAKEDVKKLL